jgi:hypothetical protein
LYHSAERGSEDAVVITATKFHQFLAGTDFELNTDGPGATKE